VRCGHKAACHLQLQLYLHHLALRGDLPLVLSETRPSVQSSRLGDCIPGRAFLPPLIIRPLLDTLYSVRLEGKFEGFSSIASWLSLREDPRVFADLAVQILRLWSGELTSSSSVIYILV
jgi:hypothetical protein